MQLAMQKTTPSPQKRGSSLSIEDIRSKTIWIRDELEPEVAFKGPEILTSDTILELASFFSLLLEHSTSSMLTVAPVTSPSLLALNRGEIKVPKLTIYDLQITRVHKALLCITGQGTRWPTKLVELCDSLKQLWTATFGDLDTIRPVLYEKGGILHHVKEESGMSRHAVLVKWMSDRTSLVSPLRAWEWGHLEYTPGQWWIHPIFAFHDGIIDSPDPHGGITSDRDGGYAITLTGDDELEGESAELFTYRTRQQDARKHRLLQTFLPPRQPIRILRSHTLHSLWGPIVGVRYDGLYKIVSWSYSTRGDQQHMDIKLQREPGQPSMDGVMKHPISEQRDDYVEYRRLRELRSSKLRDIPKAPIKLDRILGTISALQEPTEGAELEKDVVGDFPSGRRGAIFPDDWDSISEDEFLQSARIPRIVAAKAENYDLNLEGPSSLDGTHLLSSSDFLLNPCISTTSVGSSDSPTSNDLPSFYCISTRPCCEEHSDFDAAVTDEDEEVQQKNDSVTAHESRYTLNSEGYEMSLSHSDVRLMKTQIASLKLITDCGGIMSKEFHSDVVKILEVVKSLESIMMEIDGWVDRCVTDLAGQLVSMANEAIVAESPVWGVGYRLLQGATPAQIAKVYALAGVPRGCTN